MKLYGKTSISEFLGDNVVFRNLDPVNPKLPPLKNLRDMIGLPDKSIPRKTTMPYAQVIAQIIKLARKIEAPKEDIKRVVFIGDTEMNDGTAFANVCQAGGWSGMAFIASENSAVPALDRLTERGGQSIQLSNRWASISTFEKNCTQRGFIIDRNTVVLVDLDKTALGARGRNAGLIDQARIKAAQQTIEGLLQGNFDLSSFQEAYDLLNQPEYHHFTADNQDFLVYICLMVAAGLYQLDGLVTDINSGRITLFEEFIDEVDGRCTELDTNLLEVHRGVYELVKQGEPTAFKLFRYNEYRATIDSMGICPDDTPVMSMMEKEIVITQEVRQAALKWRERGALLFGISDKPDEASMPNPDLAAQGYQAIHEKQTHVIGE